MLLLLIILALDNLGLLSLFALAQEDGLLDLTLLVLTLLVQNVVVCSLLTLLLVLNLVVIDFLQATKYCVRHY